VLVADIVDIPDEPAPREAMLSRTFARVEPTDIAPQEPSDVPLEPLSLPVEKMLPVGHNLAERLTKVADKLERANEAREQQQGLLGLVETFTGIALVAGFAVWLLRRGSFLTGFLASLPAWRRFNPPPLLVVGGRDHRRRDREAHKEDE
jgi:hypothetical protein